MRRFINLPNFIIGALLTTAAAYGAGAIHWGDLNVKGNLAVTGNETVTGTLGVTGTTTLTNLSASGTVTFTSPLSVGNGGTGATTLTNHGVLFGQGSSAVVASAAGSAGQVLLSGGASADPSWSTPTYPSASGTAGKVLRSDGTNNVYSTFTIPDSGTSGGILGYTASGTLASSGALTANQLIIGGGAGATPSSLAAGSQYQVLTMGAANPGYGAVNLAQAAAVTGSLPIGNGGTGAATKAAAFDALSPMTSSGDIIYGGASGTGTRLAKGTDGQVLTLASGIPAWQDAAAAAATDASNEISNCSLATSVSGNALTVALKDKSGSDPSGSSICKIGFRSATAATGTYSQVSVSSALSVVVSSGSTLGHASGRTSYTYVYALNNAGTVELAVSSRLFRPNDRCTTTAEGGAGAADSGTTMYSTTARTTVGCRLIGMLTDSQTTAGTWASNVTQIDLVPFNPIAPYIRYTSDAGNVMTRNNWTSLSWEDLDEDAYNTYSSGTFTAPWDGNYSFHTTVEVGGTTGNTLTMIRVNKSGTTVQHSGSCKGAGDPYNASSAMCAMAGNIKLTAGQTLVWQFWFDDSTANRNLTSTAGTNTTTVTWTGF